MRELTYTSHPDDTIAAIATPPGQAGLGIVRISGQKAFGIAGKIFRGSISPVQAPSHTVQHGHVIDPRSGERIDEVMLTVLRAPGTYTAEDSVEISCHGGGLILQKVLELAVHSGARLALPGEFTLRAFLNGRIDLAQAEAVADLISARSDSGLKMALRQLEGALSGRIESLRSDLIDLLAEIEAGLDFPEQNLETEERKQIQCRIKTISESMQKLISTYEAGKALQEGLSVVIIGKPNVGKSSLLNLLLQKDRAIVTPIPGTTRDVISEYANFDGILVRLADTAGFRIAGDTIELEGIRRAEAEIRRGDLVLLVVDCSQKMTPEEKALEEKLSGREYLIVLNKTDLVDAAAISNLEKGFNGREIAKISCTEQTGLEELKSKIVRRGANLNPQSEIAISNLRHKEALERALASVSTAAESLEKKMSPEFAALDLKKSLEAVGEIIGKTYTDEILNRIFSGFCIGK